MSAPLLAATALAVGRRVPLLLGVDLAVSAGECWFVVGDNGAGKSTLLATLLGLLPALGGTVHLAPAIADRSRLGFVPQEARYGRALPITAAEFVGHGIGPDCGARQRRDRVATALTVMGLREALAASLGELSLGQRRRALVARALARQPQLLVLDEPTANMDPRGAIALCAAVDRLRREAGLGVIHVAHDLALAREFATHVAVVAGGRVVANVAAAGLHPFEGPAGIR